MPSTERVVLLPKAKEPFNLGGYSPLQFRLVCAAVWSCTFFASFDSTVAATLTSTISSQFSAASQGSWVGTSYLLSVCCFTPIYGRLADILGRRVAHLIAMLFFCSGTLFCAIAPSMNTLIAARLVAGIGGGGVSNMAAIILTDLVDLRHRGLYQGYGNIVFGLGGALGGPVGGWISDTLGWRAAFGIQVPLLLVGAGVTFICLSGDVGGVEARHKASEYGHQGWRERLSQIDYLGSATLVVAVASLVLGLSLKTSSLTSSGEEYTFTHPLILGLLITTLIFTLGFIFIEAKLATHPLLPLSLLNRRTPAAVAASLFLLSINQFSLLYNVPLFFTAVTGSSASVAGSHLLPYSGMIGIGSLAVGWMIRYTARYRWLTVGSGGIVFISALALTTWSEKSPEWLTWIGQAPSGFGYAGVLTGTLVALMTDVQLEGKGEVAVATSMSYLFRTTGQVIGVSLSSALVQSILTSDLPKRIKGPGAKDIISKIRQDTESIKHLPKLQRRAAVAVYGKALRAVFWANAGIALLGLIALLAIREEIMPEGKEQGGRRDVGDENDEDMSE